MTRNHQPLLLQRRLVSFGAAVCKCVVATRKDPAVVHFIAQVVRSATSPAANYAEARSARSRRDFSHRIHICLKELRETAVWLQFLDELRPGMERRADLARECDELTAIFAATLNTMRARDKLRADSR